MGRKAARQLMSWVVSPEWNVDLVWGGRRKSAESKLQQGKQGGRDLCIILKTGLAASLVTVGKGRPWPRSLRHFLLSWA